MKQYFVNYNFVKFSKIEFLNLKFSNTRELLSTLDFSEKHY